MPLAALAAGESFALIIGGHSFTVTENVDGSVDVGGVINDTQIGTFTANGYNSVEYSYVSGDAFQIGQFGASVPSDRSHRPGKGYKTIRPIWLAILMHIRRPRQTRTSSDPTLRIP